MPAPIVAIAEDGTTWAKLDTTWVTLFEPLAPFTPTITLKSGFEEGVVPLGARRWAGGTRVSLVGRITRTDAGQITDANAVNLGAVPSDCIPSALRTYPGTCSMAGTTTEAAGRIEILGESSTSAYGVTGDILWWYQGDGGTAWVDISGDYWMD
ncbi:hypothetical protein, partial [Streptomyces fructofermentans]|uniref:Uncharacterized protein n=1 Tax=Streptomyces fructofermentans TaxID=152141 RepID=A0A918NVV0_9ACTN